MAQSKKLRVAVLYGGRSGEHEISLQSAASVIRNLDPNQYEVIPIGIDKQGRWLLGRPEQIVGKGKEMPIPSPKETSLLTLPASQTNDRERDMVDLSQNSRIHFDVVFPVMHGPLCEDGTIQGLLELADVPYVGAGVLGSSVGMDKDFSKRIVQAAGGTVAPYKVFYRHEWDQGESAQKVILKRISEGLRFPVFVKPANLGSSVGIHKVKTPQELMASLEDAFQYDLKVLVEEGVDAREIEVAVLEEEEYGKPPRVSVVGEIEPTHEFYSYEAKYLDEKGARLMIPAPLSEEQIHKAQSEARKIFRALELEGLARVDLFLDRKSGTFYFNEVNTMPGFTTISMFPKLFQAAGMTYSQILDHLIRVAVKRHGRKSKLKRDWKS